MQRASELIPEKTIAGDAKLAVFRADGGTRIGGGHIIRCLSLAQVLSDSGFSCAFGVSQETVSAVPALSRSCFAWSEMTCLPDQEPSELRRIWPNGCDLLVVDHYGKDAQFESSCRGWASRILVIDDLADRKHDCDYMLDASPGASESDYLELVPGECRVLIGPNYALLRPEFARYRRVVASRKRRFVGIERFFACFGTLDGRHLLPDTVDVVCGLNDGFEVEVAVGSAAPHISEILDIAARHGKRVRVNVEASNMAELMSRADLGIGAAGGAALERCCVGLPSIIITTAANQLRNAKALEAAGAVARLSPKEPGTFRHKLRDLVRHLIKEPQRLREMAENAKKVCDGQGTLRLILELIGPVITSKGKKIRLRLAHASDSKIIYEWQSHSETRKYFRNPAIPSWKEHIHWMEDVLSDPDRILFVIEASGQPAAMLRLDREGGGSEPSFEVSILVAPELQGLGIAKAALRSAMAIFPKHVFHAEVFRNNAASLALFRSVGFKRITEKEFIFRE